MIRAGSGSGPVFDLGYENDGEGRGKETVDAHIAARHWGRSDATQERLIGAWGARENGRVKGSERFRAPNRPDPLVG
jgi:hypothetical protein